MSEVLGMCYYCKGDVIHSKPHDYGAFTKRYDSRSQRYILSDFYHQDCYVSAMQRVFKAMQGERQQEYEQMNIFDFMKGAWQ